MGLIQRTERFSEENWGFPEEEILPTDGSFYSSWRVPACSSQWPALWSSDSPSQSPQSRDQFVAIKLLLAISHWLCFSGGILTDSQCDQIFASVSQRLPPVGYLLPLGKYVKDGPPSECCEGAVRTGPVPRVVSVPSDYHPVRWVLWLVSLYRGGSGVSEMRSHFPKHTQRHLWLHSVWLQHVCSLTANSPARKHLPRQNREGRGGILTAPLQLGHV